MAADMAQFVHKFRANGDVFQNGPSSKVIKRNRQPLSCLPCRQRKLKCSRQQPCDTCIKREDEASCSYAKPVQKGGSKPDASKSKAQDRLRQLEELVMQMVDSNQTQQPGAASVPTPVSNTSDTDGTPRDGVYTRGADSTKYVGSTHWSAILENIQDLKATLGGDSDSPKGPFLDEVDEAEIEGENLFGAQRAIPLQQILAQYLPSRLQIDRLLSVYFNAKYMVIPYIHTRQFQREYEKFWQDPLATSPHWMSVLFSICCMASKLASTGRHGGPVITDDGVANPVEQFTSASAQCLVLGGFKPRPYVIEALALYAQCKYLRSLDPSREVGLVFAILVRLAYRMAYHRDADNFPGISVFEGEMRRRVWAMTRQFDLMSSFQLGLPPNVTQDSWDTKPPRNLLDSDFDEPTKVLPPSRPENEPTQILYFIVKSRLMSNFAKICTHALSFKNSNQFEIAELDRDVRETFNGVPDTLRIRPLSQSFADPPYLIMVRLNCEFLYQKSLLVLHRKYMTQGFEFSTKACIDSATSIVRYFADIHKEFKVGGQLYLDRWMLGSFTMNDYLLAVMILCLAMSQWCKKNPAANIDDDEAARELLGMLRTNYRICAEEARFSVEARRVAEAVGAMLRQLHPREPLQPIAALETSPASNSDSQADFPAASHSNSEAMTMPSSTASSSGTNPPSTSATGPTDISFTPLSFSNRGLVPQASTITPTSPPQPLPPVSSTLDATMSNTLPTYPIPPHNNNNPTPNPFETFLDADFSVIDWTSLDLFLVNADRGFSADTDYAPPLNMPLSAYLNRQSSSTSSPSQPPSAPQQPSSTTSATHQAHPQTQIPQQPSEPNPNIGIPPPSVNADWSSAPMHFMGADLHGGQAVDVDVDATAAPRTQAQTQQQQQQNEQGEAGGQRANESTLAGLTTPAGGAQMWWGKVQVPN
ncbi:uncharacterized protein HMPREF1541_05938 [Cyphellophora europaea CBS 101466]|uniref:Zn(2)-C6 fungal-type domain-containing protein n=1 Tax=Cyphellophora europaea (strain CBS 101466) TaxID=1220924 RepID=W2RTC9_CYPE1|nr:uncharacterized protein HMPREF1541_05938 [Cyphellophora europaea CBS 101466]ETN39712.1 hypothetical protein HMPREF1541_05938 [Cyphellophora europaea CBS 101466]